MKTIYLFFVTLIIFSTTGLAQNYDVGYRSQTFRDAARSNRSVRTLIYYPATSTGSNASVAGGEFPVIILGHGFNMGSDAYQNFYNELVPQGYIVVFVNTEGSFFANHEAFSKDMAFMVSAMQAENAVSSSVFYGKIADKTALLGHSMGGGAATVAASTVSVETVVLFAPAKLRFNTLTPATDVSAPALVFSGSGDGVTPPAEHHLPIYNNLGSACKYFININGGAHCYYAQSNFSCDFGERFSSGSIQVSRSEQQAITFQFVNSWLAYKLKGDASALQTFTSDLQTSTAVTVQNDCSSAAINSQVVLYPNPVAQVLKVQTGASQQVSKIELLNEQGNVVASAPTTQLNVSALGKGRYFAKIYLQNQTMIKKIVWIK
jgi:dienelactone hydrolase